MSSLIYTTARDDTWGPVKLMRPIPKEGDPWGVLAPLRDTALRDLIPIVSGENFSHAMHGRLTPLMREIGPEPRWVLKKVPYPFNRCQYEKACPMASPACIPKAGVPDCYAPGGGLDYDVLQLASTVILAWADDYYIVVVEGEEFSLL